MKKLIFLTALLTFLLMSFVACSDKEEFDSEEEGSYPVDTVSCPRYTVVGKLTFNSDSTGYFLEIAEESEKLVNDTLIPMCGEKPAETVKIIKAETGYTANLDGTKISSMVGSMVSISVLPKCIEKEEGSSYFILKFSYRISALEYKITYGTPTIYPDAYTTFPLSRASFNLSGHYELVNVYVHVIRKTNGEGENKEVIASQILNQLKSIYNESAHIWFNLVASDYIDYLTDGMIQTIDLDKKADKDKLCALDNHYDALDIYYLSYLKSR